MVRYEIEPQRDEFVDDGEEHGDETHFVPCDEAEATQFAIFAMQENAVTEMSEPLWLADFKDKTLAEAYVVGQQILDEYLGGKVEAVQ
jgi:hypothetical protein